MENSTASNDSSIQYRKTKASNYTCRQQIQKQKRNFISDTKTKTQQTQNKNKTHQTQTQNTNDRDKLAFYFEIKKTTAC